MAVTIKYMSMPTCCRECRFCKWDSRYEEYYCYASMFPLECTDKIYETERLDNCPLSEDLK